VSTLGQPHIEPLWKEEVNRRLAEHKSRKAGKSAEQVQSQAHQFGNSRAALAAAKVAARYAKAPSYTQMQAEEARTAVRAAEIATQVALEAQAAAESALAELHAAANEPPMRGPAVVESITRAVREEAAALPAEPVADRVPEVAAPEPAIAVAANEEQPKVDCAAMAVPVPALEPVVTHEVVDGKVFDIRWEPDIPVRALGQRPPRVEEELEFSAEDWWTPAQMSATLRNEPIAVDTQIAAANLIEFPRELVAARKMRPRLAEAPAAAEPQKQLSIFEVDPGAVSTEPAALAAAGKLQAAWAGPEWSGIELDAHPQDLERAAAEPAREQRIFLAPMGRRLMATVVDGSLILGAVFATAMTLTSRMAHAPAGKSAEMMVACGLLAAGFLYHALFYGLGWSTAGMRYAGIALCNFEDESPSRAQLRTRLAAMALSLLPMGLGLVWSVFDEDHLSWHDRISQTYLRKR